MQGPHPYNQLQMLTPQHQQQLMLAQQNLTSPSANDESRRLRMLLNNRNMSLGKDGLTNPVGDGVPNIGSPLQAGCPVLPRDPDMLLKVLFPLMIFPRIKILFRPRFASIWTAIFQYLIESSPLSHIVGLRKVQGKYIIITPCSGHVGWLSELLD